MFTDQASGDTLVCALSALFMPDLLESWTSAQIRHALLAHWNSCHTSLMLKWQQHYLFRKVETTPNVARAPSYHGPNRCLLASNATWVSLEVYKTPEPPCIPPHIRSKCTPSSAIIRRLVPRVFASYLNQSFHNRVAAVWKSMPCGVSTPLVKNFLE